MDKILKSLRETASMTQEAVAAEEKDDEAAAE